jgi:hypothetical protein
LLYVDVYIWLTCKGKRTKREKRKVGIDLMPYRDARKREGRTEYGEPSPHHCRMMLCVSCF